MRSRVHILFAGALSSCLCFQLVHSEAFGGPAILSVLKNSQREFSYPSQIANFGDRLQDEKGYVANLFLPPGDQTLCKFPDDLLNRIVKGVIYQTDFPLALLVSRGECSFDQKARVALEIQKNISSQLKYIVVYNNKPNQSEDLLVMSSSADNQSLSELDSLGFIFVGTASGSRILSLVVANGDSEGASPYFGRNETHLGSLPILIEKYSQPPGTGPSSAGTSRPNNAFHWLRFILFSLLICSPCIRFLFLWYAFGGRIIFRRNNEGRIVGLQYVRPMPYWYAFGAAEQGTDRVDSQLTEAQVLALPEVAYHALSQDNESISAPQQTPVRNSEAPEGNPPVDREIHVPITPEQVVRGDACAPAEAALTPPECSEVNMPVSEHIPSTPEISTTTNNVTPSTSPNRNGTEYAICCTMCSICIDDFEEGESIRVLPKCRHCFHLECIKPWLTERQGCCPLCKTPVLEQVDKNTVEVGMANNSDSSHQEPPA